MSSDTSPGDCSTARNLLHIIHCTQVHSPHPRLFPSVLPYEQQATSQDLLLDSISCLAWAPAKARQPLVRQAALALAKVMSLPR